MKLKIEKIRAFSHNKHFSKFMNYLYYYNWFVCLFQPLPIVRGKCFEKAMRRSFFSRDNMENFIKFCRSLGVHENLLFESDDLGKWSIFWKNLMIYLDAYTDFITNAAFKNEYSSIYAFFTTTHILAI